MPLGSRPGHEMLTRYPGGTDFTEVEGLGQRHRKHNGHNFANDPSFLDDSCLVNDKHLLNLGYTWKRRTLGESPLFKMGPAGTIPTT